ncbi:MAG: SpoIIE family protein phosphatase [Acidobacteria bacterium]|nr:SpoIIE family protein phosphatase [Acidobacteriota bacterium]
MVAVPVEAGVLEYATAGFTLPGEEESGDQHVVVSTPRGYLIAVIDAVGHGPEASEAAAVAAGCLRNNGGMSLPEIVHCCHQNLKPTRGAVMSLALFDRQQDTLAWLAVGNVEGILIHCDTEAPPENIVMRGGVIGSHLPVLQPVMLQIERQDTLIFATDGIRLEFEHGLCVSRPLQELADHICANHRTGTDDALVLVARFREGGA